MIIIKTNLVHLFNLSGMAWFGWVLFVEKNASPETILEEKIHARQWFEMLPIAVLIQIPFITWGWPIWMGLVLGYWSRWLWYVVEYFIKRKEYGDWAYYWISFEAEAKENKSNPHYLKERKAYAWIKYL